MHMHVHLGTGALSGLWTACKSLRLGQRENHRLISQLFAQPFLFLGSLTAHKEMFTVQTHAEHGQLSDNESFFVASVQWVKCQPLDAASHHREDLSGRWRETPHQQLEAR